MTGRDKNIPLSNIDRLRDEIKIVKIENLNNTINALNLRNIHIEPSPSNNLLNTHKIFGKLITYVVTQHISKHLKNLYQTDHVL